MQRIDTKLAWQGTANCQQCSIRNSVLFAGLTEADFQLLHKPVDQFELQVGDKIYGKGDSARYMYTIRSGVVKLSHLLSDGSQRITRLLCTADVVGLEATLDPVYKHDAVVLQKAEVCRYPARSVNQLSESNPRLHKELLSRWQQSVNDADMWISELSTGTAKQRIARLLLMLVRVNPDHSFMLFNREDIGSMLGITTETASRIIADFKRQQILIKQPDNHYLCDIEQLAALRD